MHRKLLKSIAVCIIMAIVIPINAQLYTYLDATDGTPFSVAANTTGSVLIRNFCDTSDQCEGGFRSDHTSKNTLYAIHRSNAEMSVIPDAGFSITATSMSVELRRNIKGPTLIRLGYSTDGGATWITNGTDLTLDGSFCGDMIPFMWDFDDFTFSGSVIFRVFFYGSGGVNGTVQLKNLVIGGESFDFDADDDGYAFDIDCNDADASVNPGASEICNGVDDNCDGNVDEGLLTTFYADADGDGYGNEEITTMACDVPEGYVADNTDCNDENASINPGMTETCNGVDDNCDGDIDEGVLSVFYADADGDGYGNAESTTMACDAPEGYVTDNTDCNDENAGVNPGAEEICNGADDNCDGNIDEGIVTATIEADGPLSFCRNDGVTLTANAGDGFTYQWYNGGVAVTGEINQSTFVQVSANVTVVVTNAEGCSDESDAVTTTGIATPIANVILGDATNDLCVDSEIKLKANLTSGVTYQWYNSNDLLEGETNYLFFATSVGFYKIEETSTETGCSDISPGFEIVHPCREGNVFNENDIIIYPNPASDQFTLYIAVSTEDPTAFIEVMNLNGEIIYSNTVAISNHLINENILFQTPIASGVYLIKVSCGSSEITGQIQIQK